ncbi:MAG TPA: hypothetical protein VIK46_01110, partial [Deferrimonas sp.]
IFPEDTPARLIREVIPHVLVKGGDWKGKKIVGSDVVRAHGGAVKTIRFLPGRSTTSILAKASDISRKGPESSGGRTGTSRSPRAS